MAATKICCRKNIVIVSDDDEDDAMVWAFPSTCKRLQKGEEDKND